MLTERFQVSFSTIYTALEGEDSIGTGGRKSFSAIACHKTRNKNLNQRKNLSVLHIGLAIHVASLEYITRNELAELKGNVHFQMFYAMPQFLPRVLQQLTFWLCCILNNRWYLGLFNFVMFMTM